MSDLLHIQGLTKNYRSTLALSDLNLTIAQGQAFGILGANGSGKTTLLGMLVGVTYPTAGYIEWFGQPLSIDTLRKRIGCIIEQPAFYPHMSGLQNLMLTTLLRQVPRSKAAEALEMVGLSGDGNKKYKSYSLGMKQRLALAAAMLHDPDTLILDEPTNGLDPMGITLVRDVIRQFVARGKTVLLASHLLDEVEKVCTRFCVLQKGRMVYNGTMADMRDGRETVELSIEERGESVLHSFAGVERIEQHPEGYLVTLKEGVKANELNKFLVDNNIAVYRLAHRTDSLEKRFLEILNTSKP